jgi:hypothetical protein
MGSYLSIVNDTPDPWQCKIGPDQAALNIAGIAIAAVGAVATTIATAGAAAPVAASLVANGVVGVFGVSTTALATATAGAASVAGYASVVGGVSAFGLTVAKSLSDHLKNDGYETIAPGQSYRWGKMTLSLWQQGTCVKAVLANEKTVRVETLYLRPIFSGPTDGSNDDHSIQWWINKWGTEKQEVVAQTGNRMLRSTDEAEDGST